MIIAKSKITVFGFLLIVSLGFSSNQSALSDTSVSKVESGVIPKFNLPKAFCRLGKEDIKAQMRGADERRNEKAKDKAKIAKLKKILASDFEKMNTVFFTKCRQLKLFQKNRNAKALRHNYQATYFKPFNWKANKGRASGMMVRMADMHIYAPIMRCQSGQKKSWKIYGKPSPPLKERVKIVLRKMRTKNARTVLKDVKGGVLPFIEKIKGGCYQGGIFQLNPHKKDEISLAIGALYPVSRWLVSHNVRVEFKGFETLTRLLEEQKLLHNTLLKLNQKK